MNHILDIDATFSAIILITVEIDGLIIYRVALRRAHKMKHLNSVLYLNCIYLYVRDVCFALRSFKITSCAFYLL